MKKNLLSIVIIALLLVNLAFTGVLTFTILPTAKKSNELITKVCSAINLELENEMDTGIGSVSIDKVVVFDIADKMTINLKKGKDEKDHYAVLSVTISMNSEHEDYEAMGATISEKESLIKNEIRTVVSGYTLDEITDDPDDVRQEILERLRALFNSDFIVDVGFRDAVFQ